MAVSMDRGISAVVDVRAILSIISRQREPRETQTGLIKHI